MSPVTVFGWAWLVATGALATHVADEARHDFLAWYNPRAVRMQRALGGLPFPPTFTFLPWITGLALAVLALLLLAPLAFAGTPWLRPIAYLLGGIHVANGLLHLTASVLGRGPVPGVLTAPLLLAAGVWLLLATRGLGG